MTNSFDIKRFCNFNVGSNRSLLYNLKVNFKTMLIIYIQFSKHRNDSHLVRIKYETLILLRINNFRFKLGKIKNSRIDLSVIKFP